MAMKQSIRTKYLSYRNSLTTAERTQKSGVIWDKLKKEPIYLEAQAILVYMDYRSEVITTGLVEEILRSGNRRVFAPKVEGMNIRFYEITSLSELQEGYQGIREPVGEKEKLFTKEMAEGMRSLVLVPGSVFDRERRRMGYGKGFYDRFLAAFPDISTIALGFDCQIAPKVPWEEHDQRVDLIVTEKEVIR